MKVVCFGQQNWDYCWTAKQQICVRLGRRGHPVLYVDPDSIEEPLGPADTVRALAPARFGFRVREPAPGVSLYTHVHSPPLRYRLNEYLRPARLGAVAGRMDMQGAVALAIHPSARTLMDAVRPAARVYYAVDEMSGFHRDPAEQRRMRREDELMIRASDAVIGVSPRLHARFARLHPNAHLVQNAADFAHFAPQRLEDSPVHPSLRGERPPTITLVGQIDERVDQALLVHVARARRNWRIVLAGRVKAGVDVGALEAEPNIRLLGYLDYGDLPSVLGVTDVCMVPYHLTPLTHGCNPLKAWEYLATGRPVVATPLDALLPMRGLMTLAEGHDAFLGALDAALSSPRNGVEERLEFARRNSWEARVEQLEAIFADAVERAQVRRHGARMLVPGTTLEDEARADDGLTPSFRAAFHVTRAAGRGYAIGRRAVRALTGRGGRVHSILVARRSRLGDAVVLLPMLRALRATFPGARIVLGVQRGSGGRAMVQGLVDEVREIDVLEHTSRVTALRALLRLFTDGFDLVVTGASYFMLREAWLTGAPQLAGVDDGRPLQALLDVRVRLLPASHETDNNLAVVEALGGDVLPEARAPVLPPPADAAARAGRMREQLGVPPDARIVMVHPGSQKPSRRWPVERFAALCRSALETAEDVHVLLTGVDAEAELVAGIIGELPRDLRRRAHDLAGRTGLADLMALLAHAAAFVCNDTGTMHVARALGTPLLALLGPENDLRWGPYPLGPSPAIALRHVVPCAPCARWDSPHHFCMRELSVDEAAAALRDLLDGRVTAVDDGWSLERRSASHDWSDLAERGHDVPGVAVVDLDGSGHPGVRYPRLQRVTVHAAGNPAATARQILDATDAPFIALARSATAWTDAGLSSCVAWLVRDDEVSAADPAAGGYRTIDIAAAVQKGGVLVRRETLAEIATPQAVEAMPAADAAPAAGHGAARR